MKIEQINFKKHPFFGDIFINLKDSQDSVLNTVVIAGNNGSGKTTMLETIFDILTDEKNKFDNSVLDINLKSLVDQNYKINRYPQNVLDDVSTFSVNYTEFDFNNAFKGKSRIFSTMFKNIKEENRPKIIYMPAEISFDKLTTKEKSYEYNYAFKNVIDKKHVNDVPTYISSKIIDSLMNNENMKAKDATDKACKEINDIFKFLDIDAQMIGLKKEGEKLPIFKNSSGDEFDINGLSSGEKQLFVRALTLKMIRANNSIILIDEPEISLHPKWQQKIIKVYEKIGKNNQIIVATHSPHIVSSVKKESVFLLSKKKEGIKIYSYKDLNSVYGKPMNIVLTDFMGLETDRDPEVEKLLDEVRMLVRTNEFETDLFKTKMDELIGYVGEIDQDIILLNLEITRKKIAGKRSI